MPTVMAYHDIKDLEPWLASTIRAEKFAEIGVTNMRTFVSPDNPTKVGLLADVPDMDALMAALQSPDWGEAMVSDGVLPETVVLLVEA
jgi:hypothetical protein